ncbi:bifunctional pantoate--beta-alanine ligase/(d)CMP kinase [Synechococcus sp. CC9311]|uniref:Bifunctional pantoate ligase/cytidylate kinase n=1 Tax=Synechococcus sp. (strain CC9311) TaxID=64471 RepID=PANCY_SYNS3|nr:RecName: Full=Bifunctional pantoate ligase/cytidylate kinase; Includes: RecName: Full=Pantothenate synthetase; Short=PS; AltName: Full=Pantoate--beta-alanine ligase; AltName: Full=Pantoate-activating enzyme; Includes: RecName: Full=Cytidylate kinase; Short=CK; AltName: Full=Cytidine monophosphate kinase; Short=CMP kinase [Synechococcus sp. CC9311]ABI45138.1 pantoate--beta-alanine ligase/cytidylate kinase [Synechococcus sp. CC9311]
MHFVPTMGGLHHGHASLISAASCHKSGDVETLVSVFVNPLQFGPNEDFARYPRTFEADCELAELSGASAIWCPDESQIYPGGSAESWRIQAPKSLQSRLCGSTRPGHFDGVVTVVCRLLALAKPHQLFLGEKDWQQLTILRRMVLDLGLAVRVRGVPTVRDGDGLASSSRNRYLNAQQRQQGVLFAQVLSDARSACLHGGTALKPGEVKRRLEEVGLSVEYVDVVDPWFLQPSKSNQSSLTLLAAAVRCGSTRLIDHAFLMTRSPLVAIDGPAGAGKSTVTRAFAERLGLVYLDTGAMYRAVTWLVLEQGGDPGDSEAVDLVLNDLKVELEPLQQGVQVVRVNGHEVTDAIRDPRVTASVSAVASHACVRAAMTAQQQRMGKAGGLVAEGRDIGTAVFPDAELKVFLTATPKERARRRALDLEARGHEVPALPELEAQIVERDRLDSTREVAPLLQADDAIELISDGMSIDQVIDALEDLFRRRVGEEVWPTPV